MYRKDLLELLDNRPMSLHALAQVLDLRPRDVEDDVRHLARSLRNLPWRMVVTPARCRKCGFEFGKDKLHKPGRCPRCHATWLTEPLIHLEPTA